MFQTFDRRTNPSTAAPRLAALRRAMAEAGADAFLVPRADAHMGENVAPCDERLAWLTGFTGSAGLAAILPHRAALFIDGRYTIQVRAETDLALYEPVSTVTTSAADWLSEQLPEGAVLGFDPWLHGREEITALEEKLAPRRVSLRPMENLVDRVWPDRPAPPAAPVTVQPDALAGSAHAEKRAALAADLARAGRAAAVLTLPESINWLLNIRGGDIARTPVAHAFAILRADGSVSLFADPAKFGADVRAHLGNAIDLQPRDAFAPALAALAGTAVQLDRTSAPFAVGAALEAAGAQVVWDKDPCIAPKARKTASELQGIRAAHLRDAAAFARFLHWLEGALPAGGLTEIAVVERLEAFRAASGPLRDIAFDTICGSGPNGAIVHYRVNRDTDRVIQPGELLLVDSGAQYPDGTTDITRTVAAGPVGAAEQRAFTLVLKGMIAISAARFPKGITGRDLDGFARMALWQAGMDYDHGTGHGVGAFLGVHEGPQGISRRNLVPLEPGMVLSNEPGYYREGAFGIRIENLIEVTEPTVPEGGERPMLGFATLTLAPIDRRLIRADLLTTAERGWLDDYHARVLREVGPLLDADTRTWLAGACAPLA